MSEYEAVSGVPTDEEVTEAVSNIPADEKENEAVLSVPSDAEETEAESETPAENEEPEADSDIPAVKEDTETDSEVSADGEETGTDPEAEADEEEATDADPEAKADEEETESDTEVPTDDEEEAEKKPDYVKITLESNIVPLEVKFSQINSCHRKTPIAYRTFTYVNSVIEGSIPPERYAYAADETDRGIRMTKWNIAYAAEALDAFEKGGRHVGFISVRVSPRIVREVDFYNYLQEMMAECGITDPEKLCLEFPRTVLYEDHENVRRAVLAMKLLKVKSMLSDCGELDCPVTPLFHMPFDYLLLAGDIMTLVGDRNKTEATNAFLTFLRTLKCELIGDGAENDDQISALQRADAFGYIPSPDYTGEVEHGPLRMTLDEAVSQSEVEDF
ncbi:MAG: EAL domain-containing protein [Clostridia bacterium]|nr:EAL domain-containing protein [Clostridia bacterium]